MVAWALMASGAVAGAPAAARAETADQLYPDKEYAAKDSLELGGTMAFTWTSDEMVLDFGPTVGWFFSERFELSLLPRVDYTRVKEADGSHTSTTTASVVVEPSYHYPLRPDLLYVFGGLGIGGGYDGTNGDFELVPRVGVNFEVGRSGVLTPAIRVPILIGKNSGPMDEDVGVDAGFTIELGFTTFF